MPAKGEGDMATPKVNEEKCTGCGDCVDSCPTEAISLNNEKAKIDPDVCAECGDCINTCPSEAITEG